MQKFALITLMILFAFPSVASQKDENTKIQTVKVINLPKTQNVDGSVAIKGPVKHSFLYRQEKIIVPPVKRSETNNLIEVEPIEADGFTSIILSFQGAVKSTDFSPGTVGVILVPDEKPIIQAFAQDRAILLPLEVKTKVTAEMYPYFTSEPTKKIVGFPRYRVFLYNSTNQSVETNIYTYLTN